MSKSKSLFVLACLSGLFLAAPAALAEREAPVPVRTVAPSYPAELGGEKVAALVMVRCSIDEQGNVTDATVQKSSNAVFDHNAVEALKRWKFKPATEDGKPIAIVVSIPVKFTGDEKRS
ncbi:MAG: energy transducer TonB [Opitutus sp.]|nr:energy transducer TonB [Opitutus sp.]